MATKKIDRLQILTKTYTQTAANTQIVSQVGTSYSAKDKVGIEISRIEYYPAAVNFYMEEVAAANEYFYFGLTQLYSAGAAPTLPSRAGVVDWNLIGNFFSTAVGRELLRLPIIFEPPEPVLVHPASLYAFCQSANLANAITIYLRMWFRYVDLTDAEFQEILQTILIQDTL